MMGGNMDIVSMISTIYSAKKSLEISMWDNGGMAISTDKEHIIILMGKRKWSNGRMVKKCDLSFKSIKYK
jgi:hypothetical protein